MTAADLGQGKPDLEVHRPFGWGILLVADSQTSEIPQVAEGVRFPATATAVAVPVRHAQDVDTDPADADDEAIPECAVTVRGYVGQPTDCTVQFDGKIEVPSGRVSVGDADHEDALEVGTGVWRLQIGLSPDDYPERVDMQLSPLANS